MTTITNKQIDGEYVKLTLSNGEEVAVQVDWATKFVQEAVEDKDGSVTYVDTDVSLLEYEITQATLAADARAAKFAVDVAAAQVIIGA